MALPLLPIEIILDILDISTKMKYKLVLDEIKSQNMKKMTKIIEYAKSRRPDINIELIKQLHDFGNFAEFYKLYCDLVGRKNLSLQNQLQSVQNGLEAFYSLSLPQRENLQIFASCNVLENCYISDKQFTFYIDNNRKTLNIYDNDFCAYSNVYLDISVFICSKGKLIDRLIKLWVHWSVWIICDISWIICDIR